MDGYVSKGILRKKVFRCVPSNGSIEDETRACEIDAYNAKEAEMKYRIQMKVHPFEAVMVVENENNNYR